MQENIDHAICTGLLIPTTEEELTMKVKNQEIQDPVYKQFNIVQKGCHVMSAEDRQNLGAPTQDSNTPKFNNQPAGWRQSLREPFMWAGFPKLTGKEKQATVKVIEDRRPLPNATIDKIRGIPESKPWSTLIDRDYLVVKENHPAKDFMSINHLGYIFRKKKRSKDAGDIRDKTGKHGKFTRNELVERVSLLDYHHADSAISKSKFLGLFKLFLVISFYYALNIFFYTYRHLRTWDDLKVWQIYPNEIILTLKSWAAFTSIAHITFLIQKLTVLGVIPVILEPFLNWFVETAFLFGGTQYVHCTDSLTSTRLVLFFIFIYHYMKMNSYSKANRWYRLKDWSSQKQVKYPDNVTLQDFWRYLCFPVFVYQANYPVSNKRISVGYVMWKLLYTTCALFTVFIVWKERWWRIIEAMGHAPPFQIYMSLYLPGMVVYYMNFMVTFEFVSNIYAELYGWQDRQFYQDFWNSQNIDEYAKKWNKVVQEFLYRHFYLEYLIKTKMTAYQSMFFTFCFSTLFHELCFYAVFRRVSLYLSMLQLAQMVYTAIYRYGGCAGTIVGNFINNVGLVFGIVSSMYLYMNDFYNFQYQE